MNIQIQTKYINPKAIDIVKSKFEHSRVITTKVEHSGDNEFIAIYAYDRCIMTIVEIPDEDIFYKNREELLFLRFF